MGMSLSGKKKETEKLKNFQSQRRPKAMMKTGIWNLEPETASQEGANVSEQLGAAGCGGVGKRARWIFGSAVL